MLFTLKGVEECWDSKVIDLTENQTPGDTRKAKMGIGWIKSFLKKDITLSFTILKVNS